MILSEPGRTDYDLNFQCLGFDVRVHPGFFLISMLFGSSFVASPSINAGVSALMGIILFFVSILVHELGHFLAARWRGLIVDRFFIWFGPPIWKKTINGVQYGLGCIPAGGFVSLPQMAPMESIEGKVDGVDPKDMPPITPLDKIIVAAAGPLFSFLLAVAFAFLAWGVKYPMTQAELTTIVGEVDPDMAAAKAGIKSGDRIISIAGNEVEKFQGMGKSVKWQVVSAPVGPLDITIERDGKQQTLTAVVKEPESDPVEGGWLKKMLASIFKRPPLPQVGMGPRIAAHVAQTVEHSPASKVLKPGDKILEFNGAPAFVDTVMAKQWSPGEVAKFKILRDGKELDVEIVPRRPEVVEISDPEKKAKFEANPLKLGIRWDGRGDHKLDSESPWKIVSDGAKSIYNTLKKVFSPRSSISGSHLSGPAGIGGLLYDFFRMEDGWRVVIFFGALLNVNLAILNLLPFPVLDGGHIVMAATEWVRRKPTPMKLLELIQGAFVLLLFGFMIFITFKDVGDRLPGEKEVYKIEYKPLN